ncbi:MAG: PIG-L family deacetylase [Terriglobia bacterium]|jgi:LmbE family N-acetylglucosaminyl deacetylase
MELHNSGAEIYVADGSSVDAALERTTHMGVAAHQDDLEIMAYHGILECFGKPDKGFAGVTVTNGAGSPRDGLYGRYSDEGMQVIRRKEQKKAAYVGEYSAHVFLDYSSGAVKDPKDSPVAEDLKLIIAAAKPQVIYTHNLADKHDTHVAVALRVIQALRELPADSRPQHLYGCEVWRNLDWLNDDDKVVFDVDGHENLATSLVGLFDSQVAGGKRYDLAVMGRRRANATFLASHGVDKSTSLIYAIDLTPLMDPKADVKEYALGYIDRFAQEVSGRLAKLL